MAIPIFTIVSIRGMEVHTIVILKDIMPMCLAGNHRLQPIFTGLWPIIGNDIESVG